MAGGVMLSSVKRFVCLLMSVAIVSFAPISSITKIVSAAGPAGETTTALPSFTEPALSPDRSEIAFVSGGDIWTVPVNGGDARLLISHPAYDSRPLYSPDGKKLAFISTR